MCNWVVISRNHYVVDTNCCFESLPERVGKYKDTLASNDMETLTSNTI